MRLSIPEGKAGYEVLETYLAFSQSSMLLVLDNFETPWNLRKVSVILTMRAADGPGAKMWF
ncbi:hypothetical protein GYMLUDRAFT_44685, partial [Collybiopsis luxurians FD-317 M1]